MKWSDRLTFFDERLFVMLESLTRKPCKPKNGGDHYFIEIDYENKIKDKEYLLAIWDAVEGFLGDRLISIEDNADRHAYMVKIKFEDGTGKEQQMSFQPWG